jgi:hypothetical protein
MDPRSKEVAMVRRACVVFLLAASAVGVSPGSAMAHVPWPPDHHQRGCVTEEDMWAVPGSASRLLAPGASENTCGNK